MVLPDGLTSIGATSKPTRVVVGRIQFLKGCCSEGPSSSLAFGQRHPSAPCHVGLSIGWLTTWQLASLNVSNQGVKGGHPSQRHEYQEAEIMVGVLQAAITLAVTETFASNCFSAFWLRSNIEIFATCFPHPRDRQTDTCTHTHKHARTHARTRIHTPLPPQGQMYQSSKKESPGNLTPGAKADVFLSPVLGWLPRRAQGTAMCAFEPPQLIPDIHSHRLSQASLPPLPEA